VRKSLFLVKAAIVLAMAFTFSCSSDDKDDPPTPSGGTSSVGGNPSSSTDWGGNSSSSGDAATLGTCPNASTTLVNADGIGSVSCGGKTYKTVQIGEQIWLAENLNYAVEGSKCYNELNSNCNKYGRLYDWTTAKTVCPIGWHLPNDAEWSALMVAVGGSPETVGTKLKSKTSWNGTDNYSFSALPGGGGHSGNFNGIDIYGGWWSTKESSNSNASCWSIGENFGVYICEKDDLNSVRCLQD